MSRTRLDVTAACACRGKLNKRILLPSIISLTLATMSCVPRETSTLALRPSLRVNYGNYVALVIGNDDYRHGEWQPLKTSREDAIAVGAVLEKEYGFRVETLLDATREDVFKSLGKLRRSLTERDNLLIYYAGHGYLDQGSGDGFWIPVEADEQSTASWISVREIGNFIKAIRALHVLVVADTCFGGVLLRGSTQIADAGDQRYFDRLARRRARLAFTSGGLEPAEDGSGGGHSAFAARLLNALLDNNQKIMESARLWLTVRQKLSYDPTKQVPLWGPIQGADHDDGEFLFVRSKCANLAANCQTPPPDPRPEPPRPNQSMWPWMIVAASSAVAVGGGVLVAFSIVDTHSVEHAVKGAQWSNAQGTYNAAPVLMTVGCVALGIGLAGTVAGLAWKFWPVNTEREARVTLSIGPGAAQVRGVF